MAQVMLAIRDKANALEITNRPRDSGCPPGFRRCTLINSSLLSVTTAANSPLQSVRSMRRRCNKSERAVFPLQQIASAPRVLEHR